jgi:hypothetical protein
MLINIQISSYRFIFRHEIPPWCSISLEGGDTYTAVSGAATMSSSNMTEGISAAKYGLIVAFVFLFLVQAQPAQVEAASAIFEEDFSTTTYMDGASTNVTGWGSGTLQMPKDHPEQVSDYWISGGASEICIDGDYAYIAGGDNGLVIINISNPEIPVSLAIEPLPDSGHAAGLDVEDGLVYVTDSDNGDLLVFNVTDRAYPELLGTATSAPSAKEVVVEGNVAYVGTLANALRTFNVTNPSNPTFMDYLATGDIYGIDVEGNFAYLATSTDGMQVVNISDPAECVLVATYTTAGAQIMDLDVEGDCAYALASSDGLHDLNVSNPTAPFEIGHSHSTAAEALCVEGNYAYLTAWGDLEIHDITDPSNPQYIDECGISLGSSQMVDVLVEGEYAFVCCDLSSTGIAIFKVSSYTNPVLIGGADTDGRCRNPCLSGNYAYVGDDGAGLKIFSILDPANPTLVTSYDVLSGLDHVLDVRVSGDCVFFVSPVTGLHIVNISDPHNLVPVSDLTITGSTAIYLIGDLAYVVAQNALEIVNITDLAHPEIIGSCPTLDTSQDVYVAGNLAYIADYSEGLMIINVTNPTNPYSLSSCNTSNYARGVWVSGDYAFVSNGADGLVVIDVNNPRSPIIVDSHDPGSSYFMGLMTDGDRLYAASGETGICVYDISTPYDLDFLGSFDIGRCFALFVEGRYIYVAEWSGVKALQVMLPVWEQYETLAIATSNVLVDTTPDDILHAGISSISTVPMDTTITYYLSTTGGAYWEEVDEGIVHSFSQTGTELQWKAVFETSDFSTTPLLISIEIEYYTMIEAPMLATPANDTGTGDSTPTFEWDTVADATEYLLQIDTTDSFDSPDVINITAAVVSLTPASELTDGWWYWRVAGKDSLGALGHFSAVRAIQIDTTAPTWDQNPQDCILELGDDFTYKVNASDLNDIASYTLNDTSFFAIDAGGIIEAPGNPPVGEYPLEIKAFDPYDNFCTATITISVEDTTAPTWDRTVWTYPITEYGHVYEFNVSASDLAGIDHYWVNDTERFTVTDDGILTNNTLLEVGEYGVKVGAFDPSGNSINVSVYVRVEDYTSPAWLDTPVDQYLELGEQLDYQLAATDLSGIDYYWVNNTETFLFTNTGRLISVESLSVGEYPLTLRAFDMHGLDCEAIITIYVSEPTTTTTSTTTTTETTTTETTSTDTDTSPTQTPPMDFIPVMILLAAVVGVIVVAILVINRRRG